MNSPRPHNATYELIVEGQNDKHVILHLWSRVHEAKRDSDVKITEKEGRPNLLDSIGVEATAPDRHAVGFILDADDDVNGSWQSIRDRLRTKGVNAPDELDPAGTIVDESAAKDESHRKPRVGIWIMPDNESSGELEDFVASMIPRGDLVWPLAQNYIDSIPTAAQKFAAQKETRAVVYAWLAAREEPRQMGLAIGARDLSVDGELCRRFTAWLDRLFA